MGGSRRRESSVIFFCLREAEPVQEQLVTLEEAQGAVENIEQGEGIVGVLRLVWQIIRPSEISGVGPLL
jgi:hypothetical protein